MEVASRVPPVTSLAADLQPMPRGKAEAATRSVAWWLLACAGMVFAMAIIGAITRLTESGLSITEWKPITGAIPPLSEAQWLEEFEKYKRIPEYQVLNKGMSLEEFKRIFFWEWFHRLWGRLIGLVFAVPFVWFMVTGRVGRSLAPRLVGLFLLGGAQGFLGWFMVQSGLVDRTDVSHYRLAAHLFVAVLIYMALIKVALGLLDPRRPDGSLHPGVRCHGRLALGLVLVTLVWGAFVAGLDAGHAYNTWPLMNGTLAPVEMWNLSPALLNFVENTAAVQFAHRWLAILTGLVVLAFCWRLRATLTDARTRMLALATGGMMLGQIGLGIATLLLAVPIWLGALHQGGALVLIGLMVWTLHRLTPPSTPA